jgi:hypothetical protein
LNDKKILVLADRVQKKIQEKQPYFRLIKKRDAIEKQLEVKNKDRR